MSLTLILISKSSTLSVSYFPPTDLNDGEYELDLTDFETYNTISNVNFINNKFHFDDNMMKKSRFQKDRMRCVR